MNGTALLINEDETFTVMENIEVKKLNEIKNAEANEAVHVIYYDKAIDWEYGY